jgi:predicted permease
MLLLIGAGLFTRSLINLNRMNPGFEPERLLTFSVDPARNGYPLQRRLAVLERIQEEIAAEPGVRSASLAGVALMTDSNTSSTVRVEGYTPGEDEDMNPNFNEVGPEFVETLGIPLLRGRGFTTADGPGAPKVAVVNETFARYYFGTADPVGRRFGMGGGKGDMDITIVGLAQDGKAASLREKPLRFVYLPYTQVEDVGAMTFYARSAVDTDALGAQMRKVLQRVDPALPVKDLVTMRAQIRQSLFTERMVASLSAAFGLLATLLAAVGLYGVMSYVVAQRTREIGIRVALGAQRRAVLSLVLGEVALMAAFGVAIGLPSGYALGRLLESELFGLTARDPLTFAVATLLLLASAFLAGYIPASRATRIDPMVALRN